MSGRPRVETTSRWGKADKKASLCFWDSRVPHGGVGDNISAELRKKQQIEAFLRTLLTGLSDALYRHMTDALYELETNHATTSTRGLPTGHFTRRGIPKTVLDFMVTKGLCYVRKYQTRLLWSERLHSMLFGPDEKDAAIKTETDLLAAHAIANPTVKAIVVRIVGLTMGAGETQIQDAFDYANRAIRVDSYNTIFAEVGAQGLRDPSFPYMDIYYRRLANRYRLTLSAETHLNGL